MEEKTKQKLMKILVAVAIGTIILILLISSAIAEAIYSGEEVTIPIGFEIVNCSVINNTENLEGLNLSWQSENIIISTHPLYKSDNLTILCLVIKYGEVVEHYSSGCSGSTKYVDRNVTIEVPKFYDRNITQIINNETIIEKEVVESQFYDFFIGGLFILLGLVLGWIGFHKPKEVIVN